MRNLHDLRRDEQDTSPPSSRPRLACSSEWWRSPSTSGASPRRKASFSPSPTAWRSPRRRFDGNADAIERVTTATEDLLSGTQAFGDTEGIDEPNLIFAEAGLTFLSALDVDGEDPSNATVIAEPLILYDTWAAISVRMDVTPVTCPCRSLRPLTDEDPVEAQVGASAIADFMQYACDIDPLFLCLSGPGVSDGQMVRLVTGGSGAAWEPGNSGFPEVLEDFVNPNGPCEDLKGTQHIRCGMGATDLITQCYSIRGVDTEMGEKIGITQDPFDFRFDMFPNSMKSQQNEPDLAPAPNIITGMVPSVKEEGPPLQPGQCPDLRHGRPE